MATLAEYNFMVACVAAETTRQVSKAAALATYAAAGFAGSALAAFRTALLNADDAYALAVKNAGDTNLVFPQPSLGQPVHGTSLSAFVGNTPGIQGGQ